MSITWRTSSYSTNGGDCVEVAWRTSSYSTNGDNCVEVGAGWVKSSYSTNGGNCVEVALDHDIAVRDTKDRDGGVLSFPAVEWSAFLSRLR